MFSIWNIKSLDDIFEDINHGLGGIAIAPPRPLSFLFFLSLDDLVNRPIDRPSFILADFSTPVQQTTEKYPFTTVVLCSEL